jgi:endonuclease-3 related protein
MGSQALTSTLPEVYRRLHDCYGPQHWWPAETRLEMIVGAILTQSAAWVNVEKGIANLRSRGLLSTVMLRQMATEELARLIYPSGYYNVKARKLKAFACWLGERHGDDLDRLFALDLATLRRELLSVYGVGEETADSIALYAAHKPVFVIDAYTRRIIARLGLAPARSSYQASQSLFMDHLPHEEAMFNEYHALLVCHGKTVCRKAPVCGECCLASICPFPGLQSVRT